jgi:broad specificity phosphatase PhoE
MPTIDDLIQLDRKRKGKKLSTVVLVGHDSVNRALLLQLFDQSLSVAQSYAGNWVTG